MLIVFPVYNEEQILRKNILKVLEFTRKNFSCQFKIIISDNNSQDKTNEIAKKLREEYSEIDYLFIAKQGKGGAIRSAWEKGLVDPGEDIFIFMDIDLATDLEVLPRLVKTLEEGDDIAIGSRFVKGARVKRPFLKKIISLVLSLILKFFLGSKIKDAPCGFKAVNRRVVEWLLPRIKNQEWFFDVELLILAEKEGYKIKEIPVKWQESGGNSVEEIRRKSKVKILKVIANYLKEILRIKFEN